jgi:hypothetical protein
MESIGPHSLSGCCPNSDTRDLKLGQSAWNQYRLTAAAMPLLHPPEDLDARGPSKKESHKSVQFSNGQRRTFETIMGHSVLAFFDH